METNKDQLKNLPQDDLKRMTDFFEILIQIDQRERKKDAGNNNY